MSTTCIEMELPIKSYLGITFLVVIIIIFGYFVLLDGYNAEGDIQNVETLDVEWERMDVLSSSRGRLRSTKHYRGPGQIGNRLSKKIEWRKKKATNRSDIGKVIKGNTENLCDSESNCFCPLSTFYKQKTEGTVHYVFF